MSLRRAPKKPDDPGIPNTGKGFRVGRMGYVIAGEASGGPFPLTRASKKPDNPEMPNAGKGFRVGRTGYVIDGEASTGLGGPLHLGRAPKKSDNPGMPNTVKSFRVGRMGYVIAGEASGGPFPLTRASKKPDNPGMPNAGKGFRVGRRGHEIAAPMHKNAATEGIYALNQGTDAGTAEPRDEASVAPSLDGGSLYSLSRSGLPFAPASATHSDCNPSGLALYELESDPLKYQTSEKLLDSFLNSGSGSGSGSGPGSAWLWLSRGHRLQCSSLAPAVDGHTLCPERPDSAQPSNSDTRKKSQNTQKASRPLTPPENDNERTRTAALLDLPM
ncbi:hypothetical protein HETIRDRAFT_100841 [Heterobasidion irregulare TC 32-1]|uniref:Uncharacterized protein n=1 Tax=Heterobasidion irregulare (strain TC 32-1) TaxID=747525 RepID=W4KKB4_HETIT|nr:uncharacterized protein HETIRDRAFT_100841 [Heterobasidion irregulare TC 32-1]ETW85511.1 hypothetical protein HETIRDRAFT_100841 [Heterobasidion irregulare TC 32-1]